MGSDAQARAGEEPPEAARGSSAGNPLVTGTTRDAEAQSTASSMAANSASPSKNDDGDDSDEEETFHDATESGTRTSHAAHNITAAAPNAVIDRQQHSDIPHIGPREGSASQPLSSAANPRSAAQDNTQGAGEAACGGQSTLLAEVAVVAADMNGQAHDQRMPPNTPSRRSTSISNKSRVSASHSTGAQDELSPSANQKRRSEVSAVSEWSHQRLALHGNEASKEEEEDDAEEEEDWKAMPALGAYDIYDDDNRLVARGTAQEDSEEAAYGGLGGAGKGYTRVQLDEDAQSATSLDEDTNYLFKTKAKDEFANDDEDDQRDAMSQLEATKDLLTEGQRIAYVGATRLTIYNMVKELGGIETTKGTKTAMVKAVESMDKWGQQIMVRLYGHMDINAAEQIMIEQLAEHGVQPMDLVTPLMQNSRIINPMADEQSRKRNSSSITLDDRVSEGINGKKALTDEKSENAASTWKDIEDRQDAAIPPKYVQDEQDAALPPKYVRDEHDAALPPKYVQDGEAVPDIQSQLAVPRTEEIEIDLRWTVLCDLFLVLTSESLYDARSRCLLERVASAMGISWIQICRFEKRVIDQLEMQEEAATENWNETDHMENRRKRGLKRKYVVMGLATMGGGLVIGLSAGLLAPMIGAGLAAGFATIGVSGTAGFLGGVGGAALITSAATAAGGTIAVRASHRRTGAVKTFEYRPLHNNKRVNLIVTVSGWMTGKVDDVRLPYSTVDPIMGDIYSVLWEPEMLQSMGDTINILATEALTQTIQQVLGSTVLVALMASIQLPVVLTKLAYLIDNPWTVSLDRANAAGLILADSLIDRHLGNRPVTLLGFSLGSRLIFSCLRELADRGAYGLVQNVYLFGSPVVAKKDEYLRVRSVVAGRFVNGYATNDWILGYLFRATSGGLGRVAGLAPVEGIPGLENVDITSLVKGHMAYRTAMPRLLREVGWEVESDEFTEIEDPDPENHGKRQRELIREIDEARKEAETKAEKKKFGFFKRGKLAEKRGWETYDQGNPKSGPSTPTKNGEGSENNHGVLFDIDAIRRELESEMIEVRELDSTMPVMQIRTNGSPLRQPESRGPANAFLTLQGLHSSEMARMNLPLRPDEIDDDHGAPGTSTKKTPNLGSPFRYNRPVEADFDLAIPRELVSTLPPLKLSPSLPSMRKDARPGLKSHHTTPPPECGLSSGGQANGIQAATAASRPWTLSGGGADLPAERNAWAAADEDDDFFGTEREVKMTFE